MRLVIVIALPAALLGFFLSRFLPGKTGAWISVLLPVAGLAAMLVYDTFFTAYNEADSYDWIIALLIGGLVSGYAGYFFHWLGTIYFSRRRQP